MISLFSHRNSPHTRLKENLASFYGSAHCLRLWSRLYLLQNSCWSITLMVVTLEDWACQEGQWTPAILAVWRQRQEWVHYKTVIYLLTKSQVLWKKHQSHSGSPPRWRRKLHCPSAGCHCHSSLLQASTPVLLCSVQSVYWLLQTSSCKTELWWGLQLSYSGLWGGLFPGGFLQGHMHL